MRRLMKMCLSMLIVAAVVFGNCSFAAIGNLTAKNTYLQLEKKSFDKMEKISSKCKVLLDTNYNSARGQVEIYGENLPGDLGNLKLKSIEEINKDKNYKYGKVILGTKDSEKASLEMIIKDNVFMVQVPELYEKYISLDFSKLKEVCEKFEVEVTDEEINSFMNVLTNAQEGSILSKEEQQYLNKQLLQYSKKLNNLVGSKYFSINNKEAVSYNDKKLNCKVVNFEISLDEALDIFSKLWQELKNDEKLLDIFVQAINYSGNNRITSSEVVNGIDEFISLINNSREELKEIKFISTLYYNSKKEIVKREWKLVQSSSNKEISFSLTTINGSKDSYYELSCGNTRIIDNVIKTGKREEHSISLTVEGIDYDYETSEFIEKPYTKVENYKVLVEILDAKNVIITLFKEGKTDKVVIELYLAEATNKKLECSLKVTVKVDEIDYKVIINYLLDKNAKVEEKIFRNDGISIDKMSKEDLIKEVNDNRDIVEEKAMKLGEELFPETIKIIQLLNDERDDDTVKYIGRLIGKATRVWKVDTETDPTLGVKDRLSNTWREYSSLEGMGGYADLTYLPYNLENGKFYVCENSYGKIVVGVSNNEGRDLPDPDVAKIGSDNIKSGDIVYIEL